MVAFQRIAQMVDAGRLIAPPHVVRKRGIACCVVENSTGRNAFWKGVVLLGRGKSTLTLHALA
jgi:hypothetical protein